MFSFMFKQRETSEFCCGLLLFSRRGGMSWDRTCLNRRCWQLHALTLSLPAQKNGTHEGEFVFYTGEQNYMDYGKIDTWNGLRYAAPCLLSAGQLLCSSVSTGLLTRPDHYLLLIGC